MPLLPRAYKERYGHCDTSRAVEMVNMWVKLVVAPLEGGASRRRACVASSSGGQVLYTVIQGGNGFVQYAV